MEPPFQWRLPGMGKGMVSGRGWFPDWCGTKKEDASVATRPLSEYQSSRLKQRSSRPAWALCLFLALLAALLLLQGVKFGLLLLRQERLDLFIKIVPNGFHFCLFLFLGQSGK
jgi:hypothetical protein